MRRTGAEEARVREKDKRNETPEPPSERDDARKTDPAKGKNAPARQDLCTGGLCFPAGLKDIPEEGGEEGT